MKPLSHTSDCATLHDPTRAEGLCDCGALVDYTESLERLAHAVEITCGQGYMNCLGSTGVKDALMRVQSLIER